MKFSLKILILPKFFEIEWHESNGMYFYWSTSLRTNPNYSIFYICWTSLIFFKAAPTILIVFYSVRIYNKFSRLVGKSDKLNDKGLT